MNNQNEFVPSQFEIPIHYRSKLELRSLNTLGCTLTDEDVMLYAFQMFFGRKLKKGRLSEKEVLGDKFIDLAKSRSILTDIINIPGEQLHHAAQVEVGNYRELGDRGSTLNLLLSVADRALGAGTEYKYIRNPNIYPPVEYVVEQGFVTDQKFQLPQNVLRETALFHGLGIGGWNQAIFPIDGDGHSGTLLGNVY